MLKSMEELKRVVTGRPLMLASLVKTLKFYKWAFGDLTASDSDIGVIGEFMVGEALGCLPAERKTQSPFDLVMKDGTTVEVKTTTTTVAQGKDRRVYRWYVNDQRTALEGKRPLADMWVFLAAKFPEKKQTELARQLSVFDPKYWTCWVMTGEQVRESGCRAKISEATFERLGVKGERLEEVKWWRETQAASPHAELRPIQNIVDPRLSS